MGEKTFDNARLESELAMSLSEAESMRVYVDRMSTEITELNGDLQGKRQEITDLTATNSSLKSQVASLTKENNS